MNNLFKLFLIALATFFTACESKSVLNHFGNNKDAAYAVQYTKKADILENNEPKVIFIATYLNKINPKYNDINKDSFLISTYTVNEEEKNLINSDFELELKSKIRKTKVEIEEALQAGKEFTEEELFVKHLPISIKPVDKNSELLNNISLRNKWAKYYIVDFKPIDTFERKLNLKLSLPSLGQAEVTFQK